MASIQGVGFRVHAGLPGVARHVGHGDEEQGHAAQDEQGEGGAGAGEGPGVVVFDPDGLIAGDHALDRLAHHLHRNDDAETCGRTRTVAPLPPQAAMIHASRHPALNLTCEGEEHPGGTEQVIPALSEREDHAEGAQDHEEQAEDGDGRCRDVVL